MIRKLALAAVLTVSAIVLAACNGNIGNANSAEHSQQMADATTYEQVQPVPHFNYSVYREVGTDVEAIQALGEQTTSFFFDPGTPDPISVCPSLGEPFPNTASLTNPQQVVPDPNASAGSLAIGQMDPNGIYTPAASSGTYVLCINAAGQKYLSYWEGFVETVSGSARWDSASHQVIVYGAPSMPSCTVTGSGRNRATTCVK